MPQNVVIPNPYKDELLSHSNRLAPADHCTKQGKMRRLILAKTREALVDEGYANFSLRDLAHRCNTSGQNIYNNFGTKKDVIRKAILDFNKSLIDVTLDRDDFQVSCISFFDIYCVLSSIHPEYVRQLLAAIHEDDQLFRSIHNQCVFSLAECQRLEAEVCLSKTDEIPTIRHLVGMTTTTMYDWYKGIVPHEDVRHRVLLGTKTFLKGLGFGDRMPDINFVS